MTPTHVVHVCIGADDNLLKIKDVSLMAIYPVRYVGGALAACG